MKKSIFNSSLFALLIICALSSCSKEEPMVNHVMDNNLSQAEVYLNTHSVPAIMFSYDVLNTDTKVMTRFLIDDEGKIRQQTDQAFSVRANNLISPAGLQLLKDDSKIVEDMSVTLDELVQNFNLLRTADRIEYDRSVEKPGPQVLKAMYGYYFDAGTSYSSTSSSSSSSSEGCGNGSSSSSSSGSSYTSGNGSSYRSILLEQKLGEDIIQSNLGAKYTAGWFNEINASIQEKLQN